MYQWRASHTDFSVGDFSLYVKRLETEKTNVFNFFRKESVNYIETTNIYGTHMYAETIHFVFFFRGGAHLSSVKSGMGFS
jgi:hypothetical protein